MILMILMMKGPYFSPSICKFLNNYQIIDAHSYLLIFWRTRSTHEYDFVKTWAIELKIYLSIVVWKLLPLGTSELESRLVF